MKKNPVLTTKGKVILIVVAVLISIVGVLLLSAWAYGYAHNMTFNDVMLSLFDSEKYDLKQEVVSLSKVKLDFEKSISDMEDNVQMQTDTISILEIQIDKNNEIIAELEKNESDNINQITILRAENESLTRVINNLTDSNNLTNVTITMMSQQLSEINNLLQYYIALNEKTYADFITLRDKNAQLEQELLSYQKLVADVRDNGYKIVTFMVDGNVHDVKICSIGSYLDISTVDEVADTDSYVFNYWVVDNEIVKDSIRIYDDTVVNACLIDIRNMVTFNLSNMKSVAILDDNTGEEYNYEGQTFSAYQASVEPGIVYCFEFTCVDSGFYDYVACACARNNYVSSFDGGNCQIITFSSMKTYNVGEKYRVVFTVENSEYTNFYVFSPGVLLTTLIA